MDNNNLSEGTYHGFVAQSLLYFLSDLDDRPGWASKHAWQLRLKCMEVAHNFPNLEIHQKSILACAGNYNLHRAFVPE